MNANETVIRIDDTEVVIDDDGHIMVADIIIENGAGRWYGVDLGAGDWDYLQDNGEYIAAP